MKPFLPLNTLPDLLRRRPVCLMRFPEEEKSKRLQRLLDLHRKEAFEKALHYEGQTLEVLVESFDEKQGRLLGRSTQNKLVHFTGGDPSLIGQCCQVHIKRAFPNTLRGELLS